ncbi:MAG: hypothetical protein J0I10_12225 [Verrucomicrobia bacterium]|nr:hypothetical protein [Verrucomicrobiota bacterium]
MSDSEVEETPRIENTGAFIKHVECHRVRENNFGFAGNDGAQEGDNSELQNAANGAGGDDEGCHWSAFIRPKGPVNETQPKSEQEARAIAEDAKDERTLKAPCENIFERKRQDDKCRPSDDLKTPEKRNAPQRIYESVLILKFFCGRIGALY